MAHFQATVFDFYKVASLFDHIQKNWIHLFVAHEKHYHLSEYLFRHTVDLSEQNILFVLPYWRFKGPPFKLIN